MIGAFCSFTPLTAAHLYYLLSPGAPRPLPVRILIEHMWMAVVNALNGILESKSSEGKGINSFEVRKPWLWMQQQRLDWLWDVQVSGQPHYPSWFHFSLSLSPVDVEPGSVCHAACLMAP